MPIRFSKAFPRRKSSGNALEELANPPQPSFRVFERSESKSLDGGTTLKRMSQGRPLSAEPQLEENLFADSSPGSNISNRGSGATNHSASSGGHNDNSSLSGRFSSSSTLPSSTDAPLDDRPPPLPKDQYHRPIPPIPEPSQFSFRSSARTFSFGRKKAQSPSMTSAPASRSAMPLGKPQTYNGVTRERAMTESSYTSGSTATPPKLLDTDLDLGQSDLDGLGTMFESFGKRRSQILSGQDVPSLDSTASPDNLSPVGSRLLTKSYFGEHPSNAPPTQSDRSRKTESSSYSRTSHDSQDALMQASSPKTAERTPNPNETSFTSVQGQSSIPPRPTIVSGPDSPSQRPRMPRPPSGAGAGLRRSTVYSSTRNSDSLQDEDARLVMDSLSASRRLNRHSGALGSWGDEVEDTPQLTSSFHPSAHPQRLPEDNATSRFNDRHTSTAAMFDSNEQEFQSTNGSSLGLGSSETTPRAKQRAKARSSDNLFDASHPPPTRLAQYSRQGTMPSMLPGGQHKVMTPEQFNRYKREQERTLSKSSTSISGESDDENENYDDDDEAERNRQVARQRRKQEAHLAVYRQQMMKMTGEQPSELPHVGQFRAGTDKASLSTTDLPSSITTTPTFNIDKAPGMGDEEDEDIPLGILAAHGFPSKNRPPSMFSNVGSNPYIRYNSESYPAPSMSTTATSNAGPGKGLPPFAKNLPADPYFGAGLVNPSNRESLAFGGHSGGPGYSNQAPNLPPGGLVGVIAGEERARAMRRGSPNAQGNYGSPLPPSMAPGQMGLLPGMPPMPIMNPSDGAQAQMSHQMNQMMQMQMQWMQQMQQMVAGSMQGLGPTQQLPPLPPHQQQMMHNSFLSPPGQMSRPMSMGSNSAPTTPGPNPLSQPRAMSMMGPSGGSPWASRGNIRLTAPSIMSGALGGQGYAPSIAPSERSNVGMPLRYRPVSIAPGGEIPISTFSSGTFQMGGDRRSIFSAAARPPPQPKKQGVTVSDDDDDEGWEEMKKSREKKKSSWRFKKSDNQGGPNI